MALARRTVGKTLWKADLQEYSGYSEDTLKNSFNAMIDVLQPNAGSGRRRDLKAVCNKYSRRSFGKVAALFINGGSVAYPATKVSLKELNISTPSVYSSGHGDAEAGSTGVTVTDVWTGEDAGPVTAGEWSTGEVPPMDSKFVVFDAGSASL